MVSTGLIPNGKAIFITNGDITIENFTFSGARVANRNGAGIKEESGNLVLNNCGFFNNEMGVLTGKNGVGGITAKNSALASTARLDTKGWTQVTVPLSDIIFMSVESRV